MGELRGKSHREPPTRPSFLVGLAIALAIYSAAIVPVTIACGPHGVLWNVWCAVYGFALGAGTQHVRYRRWRRELREFVLYPPPGPFRCRS